MRGNLFLDLLSILPQNLDCYIQAPSLDDETIKNMMLETEYPYLKLIRINEGNIDEIINSVLKKHFTDYINNIQIKFDNELLFEGFDGVEFGIISESVNIPVWFRESYNFDGGIVSKKD